MGAHPRGNKVPPLEEGGNHDKAPVNPPPLTDEDIMDALIQSPQASAAQAQSMTTQANGEVVPLPTKEVPTMASIIKDFTRMNSPTFYR